MKIKLKLKNYEKNQVNKIYKTNKNYCVLQPLWLDLLPRYTFSCMPVMPSLNLNVFSMGILSLCNNFSMHNLCNE